MLSPDVAPESDLSPDGRSPSVDPESLRAASRPDPESSPPRLLWVWALGAALMAGLMSWYIGERTMDYFKPSEAALSDRFNPGPLVRELAVLVPRNVAITYGTLGALLGFTMGLAGGLARRSVGTGLAAGLGGALLGTVAGAALSFALVPLFMASFDPTQPTLIKMILTRGGIWGSIGSATGLAFGLGLGHRRRLARVLLGGFLGGIAGTILFEVSNAMIDPLGLNDQTIPTTLFARLLASLSVAVGVAVGIVLAARNPKTIGARGHQAP